MKINTIYLKINLEYNNKNIIDYLHLDVLKDLNIYKYKFIQENLYSDTILKAAIASNVPFIYTIFDNNELNVYINTFNGNECIIKEYKMNKLLINNNTINDLFQSIENLDYFIKEYYLMKNI